MGQLGKLKFFVLFFNFSFSLVSEKISNKQARLITAQNEVHEVESESQLKATLIQKEVLYSEMFTSEVDSV